MKSKKTPRNSAPTPPGSVAGEPMLPKAVLPTKRRDFEAPTSEKTEEEGIRIEPRLLREVFDDGEVTPLEVFELGGAATRLGHAKSTSLKAPRQVVFQEKSADSEQDPHVLGEKADWGLAEKTSSRWLLKVGLIVVVLLVATVASIPIFNYFNRAKKPITAAVSFKAVDESPPEGLKEIEEMLGKKSACLELFNAFVQAQQPKDVLPLMRDAPTLKETLQKHWHPVESQKGWTAKEDTDFEVVEFGGKAFGFLKGFLPDQSVFKAYFLMENGKLRLDWKASTGFGTTTFSELSKASGDASEIRGSISLSDYYSTVWPEKDFQSYRLLSPDSQTALWCYAPRNSPQASKLASMALENRRLANPAGGMNVTLQLERGPVDAMPNQWQIRELLHFGWPAPE